MLVFPQQLQYEKCNLAALECKTAQRKKQIQILISISSSLTHARSLNLPRFISLYFVYSCPSIPRTSNRISVSNRGNLFPANGTAEEEEEEEE